MNALDIVLIIIAIGILVLEAKRGFGKVIFDFAALLITIFAVSALAPITAKSIGFTQDATLNQAIWYGLLFVIIGAILLFLGKQVYDLTLITLDTFDPLFGGVFSIGVVVIVGHALVSVIALASGSTPDVIVSSRLGMEFYQFVTYHQVLDFMQSLGS